jgi:hypothetical protein
VRLDKTKKSVGTFLIAAAANPKRKALIDYWNSPTPILCERFFDLEPFGGQTIPEELSKPLCPRGRG